VSEDAGIKGVGLALGGGIVYTVASIGVYRVLEEAKIPIGAVSGTSGGAIVGAAIAAGVGPDELAGYAQEMDWSDLVWIFPNKMGLVRGDPIVRFVEKMTGCRTFEELKMPFSVVASDINTGEEVRLTRGPLGSAVQASCSIPGLFQPVQLDGRLLVDGGIVDNLPVEAVRQHRPAAVVAVDVLSYFESYQGRLRLGIQVVLKAYETMVKRITDLKGHKADLLVQPNVSGCSLYSFRDVPKLIKRGEEAVRPLLPRLRAIVESRGNVSGSFAWDI